MSAPFVFVLGMHRSGTSCLAGSLERCGLHLGDVRRTGRHNARGYFEIAELVRQHDQILGLNRGRWNHPPESISVHPHHMNVLRGIARDLGRHRPCGIKDPRLLFLLDDWLKVVEAPHALIGSFRHPVAVAQSLVRRNAMTPEAAYDLWRRYNQRLVDLHRQSPFPLVEYQMEDKPSYCDVVVDAARDLGLEANRRDVVDFVEARLAHHPSRGLAMPEACEALYQYLLEHRHRAPDATVAIAPAKQPARTTTRLRSSAGLVSDWFRAVQMERALHRAPPQRALFFVGNPRSGTTLVRSLLDAHPAVLLGHEANAFRLFTRGRTWRSAVRGMIHSGLQFRRHSEWTGYSYRVKTDSNSDPGAVLIVGDKKAGGTAKFVREDPDVIHRFLRWVPYPVSFVHCIRHPLDVIATRTRRNGRPLAANVARYFEAESAAAHVANVVGTQQVIRIYHEALIADPTHTLGRLFDALELQWDEAYLQACVSVVNPAPHQTRQEIAWTPELLAEIADRIAEVPHLAGYLDQRDWQVQRGA